MADTNSTYYDLGMRGALIDERLSLIPNKLDKDRGLATDLRLVYSGSRTGEDLVVNNTRLTGYVSDYIKYNTDKTAILINNVQQPIYQVKQNNYSSTSGDYPILLTTLTSLPNAFQNADAAFSSRVRVNPSTGTISADGTIYSRGQETWIQHETIPYSGNTTPTQTVPFSNISIPAITSITKDSNGHIQGITTTTYNIPVSHTHGGITNDGKLGTASRIIVTDASRNIITGSINPADLVVTTDSRLSDARTPTSHTSSTASTYGAATTSVYGHVKLDNSTLNANSTSTDGVAVGKGHKHSQYLTEHQALKVLNTNNTGSDLTPSSNEVISGSGEIKLHKVSKTGSYEDLNSKPSIPRIEYNASNATLTITV